MAALAENPAEQSEDEDVAAPPGPENEPAAPAVPEEKAEDELEAGREQGEAEREEPEPEAVDSGPGSGRRDADEDEQEPTAEQEEEAAEREADAEAGEATGAERGAQPGRGSRAAGDGDSGEQHEPELGEGADTEADAQAGAERDKAPAQPESSAEPSAESSAWEPAEPEQPRELAAVGRRLGGRYRLERMVRGFGGVFEPEPQLWVGVDELLNRRVGVDLIATEHPLVEQVARAARDAAAVPDARFVQVLDAVQDEDLLYIVTEWVPGAEQLQERLADGPLTPARATNMVRDLAEAMVRAHEAEVSHGAMNPATVMITKAGEVKLRGLLVEATLSGADPESADVEERYAADVLALGQIWYAALTARWPGTGAEYGLEAAPADGARLYTPAQIRAAVPKQVDATVCRALGLGEQERFRTVKELADAIRSLPRLREEAAEPTVVVTPPRTRSVKPAPANSAAANPGAANPAAANPAGGSARRDAVGAWSPAPESHRPIWRRRGVMAVGGCAIAALATLAAFQFTGNGKTSTTTGSISNVTPHPSTGGLVSIPAGTAGKALTISGDSIWDQSPSQGSQSSAADAYSGSTTGWRMTTQKDANWAAENGGGIGLVFSLGAAHTVDQVKFQIADPGAAVEILTAPAGSSTAWNSAGLASDGFTVQKTLSNVASGQTITANFSATSAEYVAVIFTQVPQQGQLNDGTPAGYRDGILDVQVLGE